MKNWILTILAICLTGILSAQLPVKNEIIINKKIKQIKEDNDMGNNIITYNFSSTGDIIDKVVKAKEGVITSKIEYYYSEGLIQNTKIFSLISHASGLVHSGKDEYFYDSNNNLIKMNEYSWGLMQPNNRIDNKSTYKYDSQLNLANKTEYKYRPSNGAVSSTTQYQYSYKEEKLYERKKYYNESYKSKEAYEYDEKGKLIKTMYYSNDGQAIEKTTFQYNTEGLLIEENIYYLTWKQSYVVKYSYVFY